MKATGRKPSYTAEALEIAIERADAERADSGPATTAEVKRALMAATGIQGVNEASLRDHIEDVRAARKKRHEDSLVAALPHEIIDSLGTAVERQRRALHVAAGAAYAALSAQHADELSAVEREKRSLAISLQDAQDALEAKQAEIDTARTERDAARARIAELEEELAGERRAASEAAAGRDATRHALDTLAGALCGSGHPVRLENSGQPPRAEPGS
jgi:chromosome segregation ATPase